MNNNQIEELAKVVQNNIPKYTEEDMNNLKDEMEELREAKNRRIERLEEELETFKSQFRGDIRLEAEESVDKRESYLYLYSRVLPISQIAMPEDKMSVKITFDRLQLRDR